MSLKFKVGDLVKTTVTVGLDYQSFPVDSEARVVAIIPRSGIPYPYMINLTQFNRDVVVMEREIEFANGPATITKTPPSYFVEDNHGTHYTIIDTDDRGVTKGIKHNKNLFSNCTVDTSYVHRQATQGSVNRWIIKDLIDDTRLPQGQGNQATANVCTCGAEKVSGPAGKHSSWCDKKVSA
jgi:hypothetical protein